MRRQQLRTGVSLTPWPERILTQIRGGRNGVSITCRTVSTFVPIADRPASQLRNADRVCGDTEYISHWSQT
jgi:hypothetical protein